MFLCRANGKGGKIFLEPSGKEVARNLDRMANGEELNLEYYKVKDGASVTLKPATLKSGAKEDAPARKIAVVESEGKEVGSVEVEA